MDENKHRLVIDGNAFYEVDLECQRKKEKRNEQKKTINERKTTAKRQRN